MQRILITGSAGFIGSHLYKFLKEQGYKVVGIDNYSHPCTNDVVAADVDVRDYHALKPYIEQCDICFHLAAQINVDKSISNAEETIETNVLGTQNVLELAKRFKAKVIFASTSEVYGSSQEYLMDESHPLDAQSPYGASKIAGDRLCLAYHKTYGMDIVVIRNFNTFGEYQNDDSYGGVIAKFTTAALAEKPLIIFGDGTQERDYMHISDAIQAYSLSVMLPSGTVINFGSGKTISVNEIAETIIDITGSKSNIVHIGPRQGEVQRLCADIALARVFGFEPTTDIKRDLKGYIEWVKKTTSQ